jgi:hypothetical protein
MAPLIEDSDMSLSGHDSSLMFDVETMLASPLPEKRTLSCLTQRRKVSFGVMVATHEIMGLHDYTREEKAQCWFDNEDMRKMKYASRTEAKFFESGVLVDGEEGFSARGLENRTRKGCLRKRDNRTRAYLDVFLEIDAQEEMGYIDEEAIADAYYVHSEVCAMDAEMLGRRDEAEARKIFGEQQ